MIDHIGIDVSDYAASKQFYATALAGIGYTLQQEIAASVTGAGDVAGFGDGKEADFWISSGGPTKPVMHVAFRVGSRATVDAFYKAALDAGGRDNGAPGLRPHYHPNYYAAFILDPDGHNIEAVCHAPH